MTGSAGAPLVISSGAIQATSQSPLEPARTRPLTTETLHAQLGRLGGTPYTLGTLENHLEGDVILPLSELNRLRRELVAKLSPPRPKAIPKATLEEILPSTSPEPPADGRDGSPSRPPTDSFNTTSPATPEPTTPHPTETNLSVLIRTPEQLDAALDAGVQTIYADYEDIRRFKDAVATVRSHGNSRILLATPRIQKAGEEGFFKLIANAAPDGVLVRNIGAIEHFSGSPLELVGDFSLNVANPITASVFMHRGLSRLTVSHDLNVPQILALLRQAPPQWFELTLHHHMPMFHMEHCVFAAFLSTGTDHTNCGRPCELHRVHLRDRVGVEHPLRADVGCRNTLFHATPQTGAAYFEAFHAAGLRSFRIELLEESKNDTTAVIQAYQSLLAGRQPGTRLFQSLRANSQVGVTTGTYSGG